MTARATILDTITAHPGSTFKAIVELLPEIKATTISSNLSQMKTAQIIRGEASFGHTALSYYANENRNQVQMAQKKMSAQKKAMPIYGTMMKPHESSFVYTPASTADQQPSIIEAAMAAGLIEAAKTAPPVALFVKGVPVTFGEARVIYENLSELFGRPSATS